MGKRKINFDAVQNESLDDDDLENESESSSRSNPFEASLKDIYKMLGVDSESEQDDLTKKVNDIFGKLGLGDDIHIRAVNIGPKSNDIDEVDGGEIFDEDDADEPPECCYALGETKYLLETPFQSIVCKENPDLLDDFIEKYPSSDITKLKYGIIPETISISQLKSFSILSHTNKYILLYCNPKVETAYGCYAAVIQDPETDEFELIIPTYGNTYKVENGLLYDSEDEPEYFNPDGSFKFLDLEKIVAQLEMLLISEKSPLISVKKFGTFKKAVTRCTPADVENCAIRIGTLVSNESPEAQMLKRDFDIPKERTNFSLYLKFPRVNISAKDFNLLVDYLNSIDDFDNIFTKKELRVFKHSEDKLYVDIDLTTLLVNLRRFRREE